MKTERIMKKCPIMLKLIKKNRIVPDTPTAPSNLSLAVIFFYDHNYILVLESRYNVFS